jgi:hypothetical protein
MNRMLLKQCLLAAAMLVSTSLHVAAQEVGEGAPVVRVKLAADQTETQPAQGVALDKLGKRSQQEHKMVDIFKGKSWYVAPPKPKPVPPPPPPPPPQPTAPPMPYAYMGSYLGRDGRLLIFLTRGDQVYSVSPGDVLEGTYRVEGISEGQLVLIYLPLNIQQSISIGEAS